jgi:hypothetical protein
MFVGHYGPSFAAKAGAHSAPLWLFIVAAQFLDYLWAAFILTGVEHARIVPDFAAMSALDLHDMPWTHSLVAALVWSAVFALLVRFFLRIRSATALVLLAATVFSHWLADLVVHLEDLPLYPGGPKVGFGAWRDPAATLALEFGALVFGLVLYLFSTRARSGFGRIGPWIFMALCVGAFAFNAVSPPPSIEAAALSALAVYSAFAFFAWLLCDRVRESR